MSRALRRTHAAAALALAVGLAACASGAPQGRLRIELAGADAGPGSAREHALADAVRDAAAGEGLACVPGSGASLLRCAPDSLGNRGRAVVVALERAGSGYTVTVAQGLRLGRSSPVCEVQRRLADRLGAAVGAPAIRVDARSGCKGGAKG